MYYILVLLSSVYSGIEYLTLSTSYCLSIPRINILINHNDLMIKLFI